VQVQPETAIARLVDFRGFSEEDATARLANQMSNAERASIVDRVFWNEGRSTSSTRELDRALEEDGLSRG
jgi:dephospho-CoA kinase